MKREEAIERCRSQFENYLSSKGITANKNIPCIYPHNHKHGDKNPSMSFFREGQTLNCFGCGETADIFTYIGYEYGIDDFNGQLDKTCEVLGIEYRTGQQNTTQGALRAPQGTLNAPKHTEPKQEIKKTHDFTNIILIAHNELLENEEALKKITDRGISLETIKRYRIGYHEKGLNDLLRGYPECQTKHTKQRLYKYILPVWSKGKCHYFQAEICDRNALDDTTPKYLNPSNTERVLLNQDYLTNDFQAVVYVTEGYYDALSFEEVNTKAISLQGTAGVKTFASLIKKHNPDTTFVLCLDNDEPGRKATNDLMCELGDVRYINKPVGAEPTDPKDPNEALCSGKLDDYIKAVNYELNKEKQEEKRKYLSQYGNGVMDLMDEIDRNARAKGISTGINALDNLLDGGLYRGLYIIGAVSSLGKTTFILQIADYIASQGQDVLFIALEMSRTELMAKSISRITAEKNGIVKARTTRQILNGTSDIEANKRIVDAMGMYHDKIKPHLFISQSIGNETLTDVINKVKKHKEIMGKAPVVIIDYLQILKEEDIRQTDKQKTDEAIKRLKALSNDFDIPVIAVSSFNREAYTDPVKTSSYKESGSIEYGADVLIGLQYNGIEAETGEDEKKRKERVASELIPAIEALNQEKDPKRMKPIGVDIKILKNRNGRRGRATIKMVPAFNIFKDVQPKLQQMQETQQQLPF